MIGRTTEETILSSLPAATSNDQLAATLAKSFARFRQLTAIEIGEIRLTYAQLWAYALDLAQKLEPAVSGGGAIGILPQRSVEAYAATLAAVISRRPYVSLNMKFPIARQLQVARASDCRAIIADPLTTTRRAELVAEMGWPGSSRAVTGDPVGALADDPMYYMFTSGTSGVPKGVVVSRANALAYLTAMRDLMPIVPETRCSQFFDLSFDVSVHDLFFTWLSGGTVCAMTDADGFNRVEFARKHHIHSWYSVPSVLTIAARSGWLTPNALPELRYSLFAGEALPTSLAQQWLAVAPRAVAYNLYGPTEATVTITGHRFDQPQLKQLASPTVPIGRAFPGSDVVVVGNDGEPVAAGATGELWLGGPQVVPGYLHNPAETACKFVSRSFTGHAPQRWYRSGDVVEYSAEHGLIYCGRLDDQVKISGYRIELFEVEEALRAAAGTPEAVAVPWPLGDSGAALGLVGFVGHSVRTVEAILADCAGRLPTYMVPAQIVMVDALPLNPNGKVDRGRLRTTYLENGDVKIREVDTDAPAAEQASDPTGEIIRRWSHLFPGETIDASTEFAMLGGDSLTYVTALLETEDVVGPLPEDWVNTSIATLGQRQRSVLWWKASSLEASAVIRCGGIVAVLLGHFHIVDFDTGAIAALMLVAGFFFGSIQFSTFSRTSRPADLLTSLGSIFSIYAVAIIPLLTIDHGSDRLYDVLLIQDVAQGNQHYLWFIHALVHIFLVFGGLGFLAVHLRRRWLPNLPIVAAVLGMALLIGGVSSLLMPAFVSAFSVPLPQLDWWRYAFLGQLYIFACGALVGMSVTRRGKLGGLVLLLFAVIGCEIFGHKHEGLTLLIAGLLLVYVPRIAAPKVIARPVYLIAEASLFIYLFHYLMVGGLKTWELPQATWIPIVIIANIFLFAGWNRLRLPRMRLAQNIRKLASQFWLASYRRR